MADTETKVETKISGTPEKKVLEEKNDIEKKVVEEAEEEVKAVEKNGKEKNGKEAKENGAAEEKEIEDEEEDEEPESTENGDSTDAPLNDVCSIKRKSTGGDLVAEDGAVDVASPPKKAKLDEKAVEAESNCDSAEAKA